MKRPGGFDGTDPGGADLDGADLDGGAPGGADFGGAASDDDDSATARPPAVPLLSRRARRRGKTALRAAPAPASAPDSAARSVSDSAAGSASDLEPTADLSDLAILEGAAGPGAGLAVGSEPRAVGDVREDPVRIAERELRRAQRSVRAREKREQRRFTQHLRRRRRYWLIAGGAVLALALFVAIGVLSPLMAVREVRIVGVSQVNAEDLQTALARFDGVPLALVQKGDVHRALEPFPLIQRYSIERIPPHTLVVRIEERDAVIAIEADGGFELRDPAGVLVATAAERPAGVPLAEGAAANPSTPGFAAAGRVIRDLPADIREQLAGVSATSAQDVTFALTNGTRVIWGEADETQRKAIVLRSMLSAVGAVSLIDVSAPGTPVFQ